MCIRDSIRIKIFPGYFGRVYRTRGIFSERTELAEVSGTGIEVVPNLQNSTEAAAASNFECAAAVFYRIVHACHSRGVIYA